MSTTSKTYQVDVPYWTVLSVLVTASNPQDAIHKAHDQFGCLEVAQSDFAEVERDIVLESDRGCEVVQEVTGNIEFE